MKFSHFERLLVEKSLGSALEKRFSLEWMEVKCKQRQESNPHLSTINNVTVERTNPLCYFAGDNFKLQPRVKRTCQKLKY